MGTQNMDPAEFRSIREATGKTWVELADYLGTTWRSVARYEAGDRTIPGPVVKLMEMLRATLKRKGKR